MSKNQENLLRKLATMSNAKSCTIKDVNEFQKLLKESHDTILTLSQRNKEQFEAFQREKKMLEKDLSKALETIAKLKTKIVTFEGNEDVEVLDPESEQELVLMETIEEDEGEQYMDQINSTELPLINRILPLEMFKKILEKLDIKSLFFTKQTCKHWKKIVDEFKLVEKGSSKYL